MVRLYAGRIEYFNDIADELRLFLGKGEVCEANTPCDADAIVTLHEDDDNKAGDSTAAASIAIGDKRASYEYACNIPQNADALEVKRRQKRAVKIAAFRAMREIFGFTPPWGSLTGIRPTRLLRELSERHGEAEALRMMAEDFDVSPQKLALAGEIVAVQRPIIESLAPADADVYIGIPFCASRCLYCSFASQVRTYKTDMAAYLAALKRDIALGAEALAKSGRSVRAMYIGGGTPTVLTAEELDGLLAFALSSYPYFHGELTVEAGRPDTINADKLRVMARHGVNRISINPQTMNGDTLALIGRSHSPKDIADAFHMAREEGFASINMDVIAGLPGEGLAHMERTLSAIEKLGPDSLTVHTLALKRSSRLALDPERYPLPGAETAEAMVAMGERTARALGMKPYYMYRQKYMSGNLENVGYAMPGKECVYNVDMMEDISPIMANGAGAITKCVYDAARRVERVPAPKEIAVYIAKVDALAAEKEKLFL